LDFVRQVFKVMADTPQHTYQVLTKRARRLRQLAPKLDWPANVWMGVSVESEAELARVDDLRQVPAAVRFLFVPSRCWAHCRAWTCRASTGSSPVASPDRVTDRLMKRG